MAKTKAIGPRAHRPAVRARKIPDAMVGYISPKLRPLAAEIGELKDDERNARMHDEKNIAAIAASLAAFGQQKPIVIDGAGVVVAGGGVLAAARRLGWQYVAAVRTDLAGAARAAFAIADNRTGDLSNFDETALAIQLAELAESGAVGLAGASGFTEAEISELIDAAISDTPEESSAERAARMEQKFLSHPPAYVWTLIGIETTRHHRINDALEAIAGVEGVVMKVSVTDAKGKD